MTRSKLARALPLALIAALALPAAAFGDTFDSSTLPNSVGINTMWVIVAGCLVMFMQAGFAFLEIGFSRGKNAGTGGRQDPHELLDRGGLLLGGRLRLRLRRPARQRHRARRRVLPDRDLGDPGGTRSSRSDEDLSDATIESKWFFQFVFCAVSLAIVWGTTLERIKFGVYIIYAIVFSAIIYPIGAHWVFGGGFLQVGDWLGT